MTLLRQMRRNAAAVAIFVATAAGLAMWAWLPARADSVRPVLTGASFNLTLARLRDRGSASAMAAHLMAAGWPAFARPVERGARYEVVVGPYVAIDEVERVQSRLRARGYRSTLIVDESVRRVPRIVAASFLDTGVIGGGAPQVVLVGAAGRLSLVIELAEEPREVLTPRIGGSLVELRIGPVSRVVSPQFWNGPEGVNLVNQIALDGIDEAGEPFIRARMALARAVTSTVRTVGRRVYVDFWVPEAREAPARPGSSWRPVPPPGHEKETPPSLDAYRDALAPALARFDDIRPFLLSVVESPSSEAMTALEATLADLDVWMRAIEPPPAERDAHASLLLAVAGARASVTSDFDGDRVAEAHGAYARLRALPASAFLPPSLP